MITHNLNENVSISLQNKRWSRWLTNDHKDRDIIWKLQDHPNHHPGRPNPHLILFYPELWSRLRRWFSSYFHLLPHTFSSSCSWESRRDYRCCPWTCLQPMLKVDLQHLPWNWAETNACCPSCTWPEPDCWSWANTCRSPFRWARITSR